MKQRTLVVAAWLGGSIAVLAFGFWRYQQPPLPRAHVALLYDRSESMPQGCEALTALGQHALTLPHVRDGSILALFTTGDQSTGFEPVLLTTYTLPVTRRTTESNKRLIERQQAFLADLGRRCIALPSTKTSPIVQSVKQALAHLNGLGDEHTVRYLLVRSDLQETVESGTRKALNENIGAALKATPRINNNGITVVLCGNAEIVGPIKLHAMHSTERIKEVWTGLFTQPDLLQFQPYCPQTPPTSLEASRASR